MLNGDTLGRDGGGVAEGFVKNVRSTNGLFLPAMVAIGGGEVSASGSRAGAVGRQKRYYSQFFIYAIKLAQRAPKLVPVAASFYVYPKTRSG